MLTYLSTVYSDDQCHWSVSRDKKVYKILSQSKEFGFIILSGFLTIESRYVLNAGVIKTEFIFKVPSWLGYGEYLQGPQNKQGKLLGGNCHGPGERRADLD